MERIDIGEDIPVETQITGDGPPLLFLHGGDYVAQNRPFLDRLAQRFRVVAPRHPGFGGTPRPAWFRSVDDIAYLYLDLLDRARPRRRDSWSARRSAAGSRSRWRCARPRGSAGWC